MCQNSCRAREASTDDAPARPAAPSPRASRRGAHAEAMDAGLAHQRVFTQGRDAAETALRAVVPAPGLHAVVKVGRATWRTDAEERDGISYETFNPPAFWETPYSILKVRFLPRVKDDFMFHDGEEFLVPTEGAVTYHFFWSGGLAKGGARAAGQSGAGRFDPLDRAADAATTPGRPTMPRPKRG